MPHAILFTGHMIDKSGRPTPRFPPSKEAAAAEAIRRALRGMLTTSDAKDCKGIAAAACGGDILFHEACIQLGIPSELWLGIPIDAFNKTSVAFAGKTWEDRYRRLTHRLPVHILYPDFGDDAGGGVWEQANDWMLRAARWYGGENITLIALWDGDKGDGKGGTNHMVKAVDAIHGNIEIIDTMSL